MQIPLSLRILVGMKEARMSQENQPLTPPETADSPSPKPSPSSRSSISCSEVIYCFLFGLLVLHGPYFLLAFSQRLEIGRDGRVIDETGWYMGYGMDALEMQVFIFPILLFISYGISALTKRADGFRVLFLGLNGWTALVFLNYLYSTPPAILKHIGIPKGSLLLWGIFFLIGLIFCKNR